MSQESEAYIESLYKKDEDLERAIRAIEAKDMPQISVAAGYGRLLTLLVKCSNANRILEIGALGGYSGICLARGMKDDGLITSLELQSEYAEVANLNMTTAGFGAQVEYRIGDAKETLKQMKEAGERFDFFFIDAEKTGYPYYLEAAIELALPGAIIAADNVLQAGKVHNPDAQSTSVRAMREFNLKLTSDPRLDSTILPAYDGLAVARVK